MSFDHILNKLAEKHILAGNKDFAYRLVEASEKECSHCGDKSSEMMKRKSKHFCPKCSKQTKCALKGCEAKMMYAEMHKQGGKAYCSKDCAKANKMKKTALDDMIEKYAGKSEEGSFKDAIKEVPGFSGMFGNGFCFNTKEQASKALAIAEQAVNFLNWKVERHDDGFMVISRGKDKEASVLKSMLNKYAGIEDLKKWQAEHGKGKKSSACPDCGKKKCTCSSMTACAGSMCKAKMQKRHMHMAGGNHYCCAECASEHMSKKAYASDHHDTRMKQYPENEYQAPEWLQHEFEQWLNKYHGSLHQDDDRDLLWDKFMLEKFGEIEKYAKTKKKAFVNAGDLLRRYSMDLHDTRMKQYPENEYQAPEWLQHEFEQWLNKYHGSLHQDDDRDLLWDKFMLEKFGEIEKYAKTKKKAFVNAGDLLRKYAEDYDPSLSGDPNMNDPYTGSPGFEYELKDYGQEYGFKGQDEQDEQDQEELLRKEELEHRDYDQGYSAGYNKGYNKGYSAGYNDGFNADSYIEL